MFSKYSFILNNVHIFLLLLLLFFKEITTHFDSTQ